MGNAKPYLASVESRLLAQAMDLGILFLASLLVLGVLSDITSGPAMLLAIPFLYVSYNTIALTNRNYGIGRVIVSIQVVSSDGNLPTLVQALIRSTSRVGLFVIGFLCSYVIQHPFMIILPGLIEIAMMMFTPQRQSIADMLARTFVIKMPQVQPHRAPAGPMYSANDSEFGIPPKRH